MEILKKNTIATKFKQSIQITDWGGVKTNSTFWIFIAILGLTTFIVQFQEPSEKVEDQVQVEVMDTYIPEGMSLVPIRVSNYESLDQIIGQFGVVDLLTTPLSPSSKPKRIAYAVKLVRSPKSPRHFSVLVPADKAHKLVGYHGEFTVSVRNPKILGTKFVKQKVNPKRGRIIYGSEDL